MNPTIQQGELFMVHDETLGFEECFALDIFAMIQTLLERGGIAIKAVESD